MTRLGSVHRVPALACLAALVVTAVGFGSDGWVVDRPRPGVLVLRDDHGQWGGPSMGVAHQNQPRYQVRKTLDLSALPPDTLPKARSAWLRLYFGIQDYSWAMGGRPHNGLNETFEVVVNGHVQEYKTSDPRFASKGSRAEALRWDWVDLDLPVSVLRPGHNEVIVRKRPGTNDDYIYPGIDNTTQYGHSAVSMDGGKTWNPSRLNAIGAQGEYMIRLGVATVDLSASATWSLAGPVDDPHGLIAYAGQEAGALVLEMAAGAYDPSSALTASAAFRGPAPAVAWLDDMGKPLAARVARSSGRVTAELPAGDRQFVQLRVRPPAGGQTRSVTFRYTLPIGLMFFDSEQGQETSLLMAAVAMSVVPMVVLFVVLQKYLVKGIQLGSVKG